MLWNGCELMIPSVQCRFTDSAAFGGRCHSVCLRAGSDNSAPLRGLFYGGGMQVLKAQMIGSACITLATFGVAMVVMLVVNAMGLLRLPAEDELYGMDLHEHGISAYPEYVISAIGAPGGMTQELPVAHAKASTAVSSLSRAVS